MPNLAPGEPGFGRAQVCVCRQQTQEEQRVGRLARMSQLGLLREKTFERYRTDIGLPPHKQLNLKLAFDRAKRFAENPKGWLLLRGGYGCGKTHLAAAIANHRIDQGQASLFINTPDLLDHLRGAYSPSSDTSYDELFEKVRSAPLLILDDLGTQNNTEWAQEKLYQIFNHRHAAQLPTVITTNNEIESFEHRLRSRLEDQTFVQVIMILAPDYRRGGVDQDESDLSTLQLHNDKTFSTFNLRENELPQAQSKNLRRAYEKAVTFAEVPDGWLVYQSLNYANGKTHLAAAIANHVASNGTAALFVLVPDLLDHLRATFNPNSNTSLDKIFTEVRTAPLLVLDDLGTESATAWAREKLYQLFNYRYNAQLPTVITTTTPVDEIDPRLASRLFDGNRSSFFIVEAPSFRGAGRKRNSNGRRHRH